MWTRQVVGRIRRLPRGRRSGILNGARLPVVDRRSSIANLTFHGVGNPARALDPGEDRVWISEQRLTQMLDALAQLDVDPAREPEVNITVDDGNRSDVGVLAPA